MLKTKWISELLFVISFVMRSAQKCWANAGPSCSKAG